MKKVITSTVFCLTMLVSAIASSASLYITWPSGYPTLQNGGEKTPVNVNNDGTFNAGNIAGNWHNAANGDIVLEQHGGPSCYSQDSSMRMRLIGSMVSSNPLVYSGYVSCVSYYVGGAPTFPSGSWVYH